MRISPSSNANDSSQPCHCEANRSPRTHLRTSEKRSWNFSARPRAVSRIQTYARRATQAREPFASLKTDKWTVSTDTGHRTTPLARKDSSQSSTTPSGSSTSVTDPGCHSHSAAADSVRATRKERVEARKAVAGSPVAARDPVRLDGSRKARIAARATRPEKPRSQTPNHSQRILSRLKAKENPNRPREKDLANGHPGRPMVNKRVQANPHRATAARGQVTVLRSTGPLIMSNSRQTTKPLTNNTRRRRTGTQQNGALRVGSLAL